MTEGNSQRATHPAAGGPGDSTLRCGSGLRATRSTVSLEPAACPAGPGWEPPSVCLPTFETSTRPFLWTRSSSDSGSLMTGSACSPNCLTYRLPWLLTLPVEGRAPRSTCTAPSGLLTCGHCTPRGTHRSDGEAGPAPEELSSRRIRKRIPVVRAMNVRNRSP